MQVHGDHLEGAQGPELEGILDPLHLAYVRQAAREGVRARSYTPPGPRIPCKPHASAMDHIDECLAKLWEHARWGGVLLVSNQHTETLEGIQFYLTTWDSAGEGGLRPLAPEAASFTYGGAPADEAKVMDEVWISSTMMSDE